MELVEGPRQQRGELRESRVRLRDGGCPHADGAAASTVGVCSVSSWIFTERLAFPTQATYQKLLPLYFPRSLREESRSLPYLPADIGNADGEPVVPERQIRISEKPGAPEDDQEEEDEGLGVDLSFIGSHAFARMEGDIDKQRRLILQGQLSEAALQKQHQRK